MALGLRCFRLVHPAFCNSLAALTRPVSEVTLQTVRGRQNDQGRCMAYAAVPVRHFATKKAKGRDVTSSPLSYIQPLNDQSWKRSQRCSEFLPMPHEEVMSQVDQLIGLKGHRDRYDIRAEGLFSHFHAASYVATAQKMTVLFQIQNQRCKCQANQNTWDRDQCIFSFQEDLCWK